MKKFLCSIWFILLATIAFGIDKTYKASSGDLILDANNDVVVNKNLGVGTSNPDNELEVRGEISLNKFSNTPASPAALSDWPNTPVMIRSYDQDYDRVNILGFGYPNDSYYKTDSSIWLFRLMEADAGVGHTQSASTTNLNLYGPGNFSILANYVGIGVIPSYSLHVDNDVSDYLAVFDNGDASGHGLKIVTNNSGTSNIALRVDSTLGEIFNIKNSGTTELSVRADSNCGIGNVCSGTHGSAGHFNDFVNSSFSGARGGHYIRVGNVVNVTIWAYISMPSGGASGDITLPFASTGLLNGDVTGIMQCNGASGHVTGQIRHDSGGTEAEWFITTPITGNHECIFVFQYKVK